MLYIIKFILYRASIILTFQSICTPPDEKVCKIRSPNLKYAVGLIVRHKHYGSDIAGVIIGWHNMCQIERFKYPDTCCTPNKIADVYMLKYNVHNNWKLQPSYVLLIDNDLCYVPQSTSVIKCFIIFVYFVSYLYFDIICIT